MPTTSGMKDGGFYDQHSSGQRSGIELLLHWVDWAAERLELPSEGQPIWMVDYGCSEGRNAMLVLGHAAEALRRRGAEHAICPVFSDLPSNNFNRVFLNLSEQRQLAAQLAGNFPMAVGGSFYGPLLPPGIVRLATSFNGVCWLDQLPDEPVPDFVIYPGAKPYRDDVRVSQRVIDAFRAQAERDLVRFLTCRAEEMASGGRLIVAVPGCNDEHWTGRGVYDLLHDACVDLVHEGRIDRQRYEAMLMPVYFRSLDEMVGPVERAGSPLGAAFTVEKASCDMVPTAFVVEYETTGNLERYVDQYVGFFQAFSEPIVRAALEPTSGPEVIAAIYQRAEQRLRAQPAQYPFHYLQSAILLARK